MYDAAATHASLTHKFTGKERDPESGLDYFGARHDASNLARFMSPDKGTFHYEDPQSLNRYAYTLNNPLRFIDPNGLEAVEIALFWLTVWVPTGQVWVPGDLLSAGSSAISMSRPPTTWANSIGTPSPNTSGLNTTHNLAVADASDGPMCPPACATEYRGVTNQYRLVADFQNDLSNSSGSKATLSEILIPNSGSISAPGGGPVKWSSGSLGPPPDFRTHTLTSTLRNLSDKNLEALVTALFKASQDSDYDEAVYDAWVKAKFEEARRRRQESNQ